MKQKLKTAIEVDWVGSWRKFYNWKPGVGKTIKRQLNKRLRREGKKINP